MADNVTTLDRAVQLASSGRCGSINQIRQLLRREGYTDVATELSSPELNRRLVQMMRQSLQT